MHNSEVVDVCTMTKPAFFILATHVASTVPMIFFLAVIPPD
jgi:hypothetical protein